jgi:hypothetical protein
LGRDASAATSMPNNNSLAKKLCKIQKAAIF